MAKKRYTKLEEEIIQILNEKDRESGWRSTRLRLPRLRRPQLHSGRTNLRASTRPPDERRFDLAGLRWLLGSFGLALAAILIASWSHLLAVLLAIAAILFFLSPMVRQRTMGPPTRTAQRWRGRDIELPPSRGGLLGDLRYRLWQFRQRR